MDTTTTAPAPPFPFERFRRLRFGDRPHCPHCDHDRVHRWGSFSGRRRYRCTGCTRTFSDFTGTPLANLNHVDRWPAFGRCVLASLTVRRTAALLGVDPTTAFRWRHRLLRALDASDTALLGATVIIHETWFPHSEKGSRNLDRPPRRRSVFGRLDIPKAWVVVAGDELGRRAGGVVGSRRPGVDEIRSVLEPRLEATNALASTFGPWGAAGLLADRTDRSYRRVGRNDPEFAAVQRSILTLRRWLRHRFHGVATRYLANYLAWHRLLELSTGVLAGRPAAALAARPARRTHFAAPRHWLLAGLFP